MKIPRRTTIALLGGRILLLLCAFTFFSQPCTDAVAADEQAGTPAAPAAATQELAALTTIQCPNTSGPDVAVYALCTDLGATSFGAQNLVNTLVADGRFGSVTLIDADVVQPTADELLDCFDCVIAATDNRCFGNAALYAQSGPALAGFASGGGGLVLSVFGFSTSIGFGPEVFAPGLSPFQKVTGGNFTFNNTFDPNAVDAACDCLVDGVVSSFNSRWSNRVTLSAGATLCANFTNGNQAAAINAAGNVMAINSFPFDSVNNSNANYKRWIANAVFCVCEVCEPVEDPDVRTQGFWKRVCKKPHPSGEHENLPGYVDCVNDTATFSDVDDVDELCDRLHPDPRNDKCEQAEAQFMALLLNVCSGRVATCNCVFDPDLGDTTVGDAIEIIDALLVLGTFDDCALAQSIAAAINEGLTLVDCP